MRDAVVIHSLLISNASEVGQSLVGPIHYTHPSGLEIARQQNGEAHMMVTGFIPPSTSITLVYLIRS